MRYVKAFGSLLAVAVGLAGCGSSSSPPLPMEAIVTPTPLPNISTVSFASPVTFDPPNISFTIFTNFPSQDVTATNTTPFATPVTLSFSDPTVVGASMPTVAGAIAKFTVFGVAHGSTVITATDATGATGSLPAMSGSCGRPDAMSAAPILLSPKSGATSVPTNIGTLYFALYTIGSAPPQVHLHVIVGAHGTFEAGSLSPATLPAGTATAPPASPNQTLTYESATVPSLAPGTTYRPQLYDDACQPAEIAGSFST